MVIFTMLYWFWVDKLYGVRFETINMNGLKTSFERFTEHRFLYCKQYGSSRLQAVIKFAKMCENTTVLEGKSWRLGTVFTIFTYRITPFSIVSKVIHLHLTVQLDRAEPEIHSEQAGSDRYQGMIHNICSRILDCILSSLQTWQCLNRYALQSSH